jgi:predicted nucleic acid-binding protein
MTYQSFEPVLVLCDEREARRACTALGLPRVGSVGLILTAFKAGRIERAEAERSLRELPGRGRLYVTAQVIEMAVQELNQPS